MKTTSIIVALLLSMFALSSEAAVVDFKDLTAVGDANVYLDQSYRENDKREALNNLLDYPAVSLSSYAAANVANVSHLKFDHEQYIKVDDLSSSTKKVKAIEPNTLLIFGLGLLALYVVRRNQSRATHPR